MPAAIPSLDEIKTAAQYAFKQGNFDDAKTLDDLYKSQYTAQQPAAQPQQPVDPMAAYQTKVAADKADTKDGALGYSVDQAQKMLGKGIEAGGQVFGSDAMTQYGSQVVEQQDKDIATGGYQSTYNKSLRETYNEDGLGSAIGWAAEKTAENAATGGAALIGGAAAAVTAPFSMPLAALIGGVTTVGSVTMGAGESAFEQEEKTGSYDAKLALGVGTLIGFLDKFGAGKVIPKDRLMKMTAEQISEELAQKGFAAAAAGVLKKTGIEAATETAQEGLSIGSAAIRGGEYTPQELGDRALEAAVLGGTSSVAAQGGIGTLGAATNLVSGGGSKPVTQREEQARAAFAQRLASKVQASQNADGPAYDLGDVDADSPSGAKAVIDSAHSDMTARLKALVALLKARIAPDKADRFDTVIEKSDASLAAVKAKNKVKNVVDVEDFAAFEELVGDTAEGQEAINLMHEMNELTRVYSNGLTGGLSRFTDNLNPLGGSANYSGQAAQKAIAPYASMAGFIASPALTAAQLSGFVGGRAIDKLTGRRSRVANYVAQNQGNTGQAAPTGPSLRNQEVDERNREAAQVEQEQMQQVQQQQEAQAQQEAEVQQQAQNDADLDERIYNQGGMPAAGGPEGTLSSVLGLDTEQLMNLLDQVIETEPNPELVDAAIAAQQSIVRGGTVPNLTRLIRILKPRINPDPQFWIERERGAAQQGAQVKLSRQEENYQRGIENNRKAAAALSDELNADGSITKVEKALLLKSLQDLQLDLGLNPVATLESMYKRLQEQNVSPEAIDKYLAPYMDRVTQQQENKQAVLTAQDEVQDLSDPMDSRSLGAPVLEETTEQRKQRAEEQGYDTSTVWYHGAKRLDRLLENNALDPKRATSGPMPFFTDSPELATGYAQGKQDTSLVDDGFHNWFKFKVGRGKAKNLNSVWQHLPDHERTELLNNLGKVTQDEDGNIVLGTGIMSPDSWDWTLKQARGNPIKAAEEAWLLSGTIFANEEKFVDVLKVAGLKSPIEYNSPDLEFPGILPAYAKYSNPLDTANIEELKDVLSRLEYISKNKRYKKNRSGVDQWDKNSLGIKEFADRLKTDLEEGTTYAWTSIPDEVVADLKDHWGYDAVIDKGGKGGGQEHNVLIPFYPNQMRSVNAQFDPNKTESAQLTDSRALGAPALEMDSAQLDLPFGKPDVIPNMARPTTTSVKQAMPKAQEAFEVAIGKPGSKFEKGVSTEADIIQIAEILNIIPKIFDNRADYLAASGKSSSDTSLGNFLDFGDSLGETRVLAAGVKNPADGKPITNLDFLITLVHENIGHALESRDRGNAEANSYLIPNMHPQSSGRQDANSGSLRALITHQMGIALDRGGSSKQEVESAQKIRAEIEAIQDQIEVSFENSPQLGTAFLRDSPVKWEKELIAKMDRQGEFRKTIERQVKIQRKIYEDHYSKATDYIKYKRNNAEFSVDPIILYVMNPTLMKKVAPETAKMIRDHFNSSKIPVSFHANPIVTVLAIIMAGVAQMEDDEEEKKNPGALTPEPGALTA